MDFFYVFVNPNFKNLDLIVSEVWENGIMKVTMLKYQSDFSMQFRFLIYKQFVFVLNFFGNEP